MYQILRTLLPRCEASTRTLLSGFGASGVLHVLAGAALATWFGSLAPHLFPPQQGFNSIQLAASQVIVVEAVDAEPEAAPPVVFETSAADGAAEPDTTILRREAHAGTQPAPSLLASVEALAPSARRTDAIRRSHAEPTPAASDDAPVLPRAEPAEPPLPTQTSVASMASQQDAGQLNAIPTQIYSPQPEYPAEALQRRLEGRVVLRVKIDTGGRVAATSVLRSSGHPILDEAASQAVLRWRFDPPMRFGVAISTEVAVPVRFRIEEE
jgi:protein TonB